MSSRDPEYTEFEQGQRQELLQLRSFIAHHGVREASDYAATRLHDIRMDALHREEQMVSFVEGLIEKDPGLGLPGTAGDG